MKSRPPHRIAAILTLGCALLPSQAAATGVKGQEDASATAILLSRARTLEQRGRLDLAKQDWSQVLLADPNEAEALAGLVRAARAEGRTADADRYLARLRAAHPNSPELARLQGSGKGADTAAVLAEADKLARGGDARAAMVLYRRVYGMNPPPGTPALAYYETESATEEGRPQAIAGLRALADRFPQDVRYRVALGRILLGSARTRAEGRTILEDMPANQEAVAALRGTGGGEDRGLGAMGAAAGTPTGTTSVAGVAPRSAEPRVARAEPKPAPGTPSAGAPERARAANAMAGPYRPQTARSVLVAAPVSGRRGGFSSEEQAAFAALNEHRTGEAEQMFRAILMKDPKDARALAGMGYLRETAGDLRSAVMFFEQAQESGDRSLALTRAIVNAQFELALKQVAAERARGNLPGAETQYRAALRERPNDPEALEGLGGILLQEWRPGDAIPVYEKLTRVRPMDPGAWRGLVVAETSAGRGAAALAADAQVPAGVRSPLAGDQGYQRALGVARESQGTQVARVEPPVRPTPSAPSAVAVPPPAAPVRSKAETPSVSSPAAGAAKAGGREGAGPPAAAGSAPVSSAGLPATGTTGSSAAIRPAGIEPGRAVAPTEAEELQQADLALLRGQNAEAATMFRAVAARVPARAEGWRGLVLALHNGGREAEAAGVMEQIPASARSVLDRDASFQAAAGGVFLASRQPNEALRALARAQEVFSSQRLTPPLDLVLETARLLAARGDDENLYRELMYLGERKDLTDARRVEIQMIWTRWAVRRARALAAGGDDGRALTLLNAAATAFSGNPEVVDAVAEGYAGIGKPREAVALYRTQDLTAMTAAVLEAAVDAAAAAHDFHTAESWMRIGLQRFGSDPQMVNTAAELAQARGREKRAVALSQQAKALAPAQNPGQVLAAELKEAPAGQGWPPHSGGQLGVLLAPGELAGTAPGRPYLPAAAKQVQTGVGMSGTAEPPVLAGYDEPSR